MTKRVVLVLVLVFLVFVSGPTSATAAPMQCEGELFEVEKEGLLACLVSDQSVLDEFLVAEAFAEEGLSDEVTGGVVNTTEGTFPIRREQLFVEGLCTMDCVCTYEFFVVDVEKYSSSP